MVILHVTTKKHFGGKFNIKVCFLWNKRTPWKVLLDVDGANYSIYHDAIRSHRLVLMSPIEYLLKISLQHILLFSTLWRKMRVQIELTHTIFLIGLWPTEIFNRLHVWKSIYIWLWCSLCYICLKAEQFVKQIRI